jgi:hypothetical protein
MARQEERASEDGADEDHESAFAWEWRVMVVSAFWALPGVIAGALARLCVADGGPVSWWMVGGALLAATVGGLMESDHLF